MDNKHVFAVFIKDGIKWDNGKQFIVNDKEIIFRIVNVLRLKSGQQCILFDDQCYATVTVMAIVSNKSVHLLLTGLTLTKLPQLQVRLFLAFPKKPAFEDAVYFAVEAGASKITPVVSSKSQVYSWSVNEQVRLQKIIISAREQAKSFAPVFLTEPISFDQLPKEQLVVFDAEGIPFFEFWQRISQDGGYPCHYINLLVGSEAGFSANEMADIVSHPGVTKVALTSNILRTPEAVLLACALFNLKF
jgi:16S rRNA (uracil1498-N3)-methyltransferase